MQPIDWIPPDARSLLDVGCNVGEFLAECRGKRPDLRLAGVDVNRDAVAKARAALPGVEIERTTATMLPFAGGSFDCVTCIEVLEHIPEGQREAALREIGRVLRPGGSLILRVPHAGATAWLDSNNVRFRFPRVYRALVGSGRRDAGYEHGSAEVVWHEHFTRDEVLRLAGDGWILDGERRGGLFIFPLTDWACWPLYRLRRTDNALFRGLQQLAHWDINVDYGALSFDMLLRLRRA